MRVVKNKDSALALMWRLTLKGAYLDAISTKMQHSFYRFAAYPQNIIAALMRCNSYFDELFPRGITSTITVRSRTQCTRTVEISWQNWPAMAENNSRVTAFSEECLTSTGYFMSPTGDQDWCVSSTYYALNHCPMCIMQGFKTPNKCQYGGCCKLQQKLL